MFRLTIGEFITHFESEASRLEYGAYGNQIKDIVTVLKIRVEVDPILLSKQVGDLLCERCFSDELRRETSKFYSLLKQKPEQINIHKKIVEQGFWGVDYPYEEKSFKTIMARVLQSLLYKKGEVRTERAKYTNERKIKEAFAEIAERFKVPLEQINEIWDKYLQSILDFYNVKLTDYTAQFEADDTAQSNVKEKSCKMALKDTNERFNVAHCNCGSSFLHPIDVQYLELVGIVFCTTNDKN